jgi:hypothetical protein
MSEDESSTSDYLLVPTNVQAFLVGTSGETVYDLAPVPQTEDDLAKWYLHGSYSFSFQNANLPALEPGIHLHWALPAAIMHSRHPGTGEPEQPCIPNRWLVLRMWHAAGNSNISSKAWIVESDYITDKLESGGTPFLLFNSSLQLKYVGRTVPLEGWQETNKEYRFELKSFGWGDPTFAAYYPSCKGTLGFHDKLEDLKPGDLLAYLVIGWYSDPVRDPLHPAAGRPSGHELLATLGWSCTDLAGAAFPQRTLCHGGVVNIQWKGSEENYQAVSADSRPPTIAIGGSAAEALAALLAPDTKPLQQVLCAFEHGQARQVSEWDQLGDLLHRRGFGAVPGGKLWWIEPVAPPPATPGDMPPSAKSSSPPMSAKVQNLLRELNETQRAFDRQARQVESLRSQLFACWATWASKQTGPSGKRPKREAVTPAIKDFGKAKDDLPKLRKEVELCRDAVAAALTAEATGMRLTESSMPPFLHPKDPFVVLAGENLIGVDRARSQRPDPTAEDALPCRLAKDVVTGVRLSGTVTGQWQAKDCLKLDRTAEPPPLGELMRKLALEILLFDPNCAKLVRTQDPALFDALQKSLDPKRELRGNTLTWNGQPPDPLGVTRWGESNPWLPVYLMWKAHWAPTYTTSKDHTESHHRALEDWQPDLDRLAGDLVPKQELALPSAEDIALEGSTVISPLSGKDLATHLRNYAKSVGNNAGNLEVVEQMKALGQSLGGLNDLLVRQTLGPCLPPVDPEDKQVDENVWEAMGRVPQPVMPVTSNGTFLPWRAGTMKLTKLFVVDSFGQTRKLIDAGNSLSSQPRVIASAALPPPPADYHAMFSPRLVQPARLNFDWQRADADASGPVCGWIVANYLENSFAVFSAGGAPLGSLESMLTALDKKAVNSKVQFKWRPIPGSTLAIEDIGNAQLQRFVGLVTEFTADEVQVFLELVDLVLRRTEGRVPAEDPAMAVLLGRPLALVRASLELEVQGLPVGYWQTDDQLMEFVTEGFEKLRVPVRLGGMNLPSDGLVGYMHDKGGPNFFASEGAKRRLSSDKKIKYGQDLTVACADKLPVSLTLLMDASAGVHAATGILPRHRVSLPPEAARLASLIKEIYIGVAPVLGERPHETSLQPVMPRPSDAFGQWSWATRPNLTGQGQTWHDVQPADDRARFADGLALTEGWLRLRLQGK